MFWLWLLGSVTAFRITSFSCEGPVRSNQPKFNFQVIVNEAIKPVTSSAITIVKGTTLQTRANIPPNLDFDTQVSVELSNFTLDSQNRTLTFSATASVPSATEVPFLLQIRPGSLQSLAGAAGPDAIASLLLIYDTKAPNVSLVSLVGAYSNKSNFTFDITFGERVPEFTLQNIQLKSGTGVTLSEPVLTLTNASLGQYLLALPGIS